MATADARRAGRRIAGAALAFTLLLGGCGAPEPRAAGKGAEAGSAPAMRRFVETLARQDTEGFAALFPRDGTWRYVSTIANPPMVAEHTGAELARDLAAREGLYGAFFEDFGLETFRDHVTETQARDWVAIGPHRYAPPRADPTAARADAEAARTDPSAARVYVEWRQEEGRWVVSEVAEPAS